MFLFLIDRLSMWIIQIHRDYLLLHRDVELASKHILLEFLVVEAAGVFILTGTWFETSHLQDSFGDHFPGHVVEES